MVKLSCIEEWCQYETQDLTFDQAERILQMHLDRKHSNANQVCMTSTPVTSPSRQSSISHSSQSDLSNSNLDEISASSGPQFPMPQSEFYVALDGFPTHDDSCASRYDKNEMLQKYKDSGLQEDLCFAEDEAGTFTGMAVMKLRSLDDKNRILNSNTDYSQIFGYDITIRETTASEYFKYAQNLSGKTKYIRLKGLEWSRNEDHIRREFLVDVRIETVIMTKNSAGKPTGEAYLELYSVEETEKSKKYNRKFLGQRFVVIEEITEEQFLLVKLEHIRNPQ